MGRMEHIVQADQGAVVGRLGLVNIYGCSGQFALLQRLGQGRFVYKGAARGIDEASAVLHLGNRLGIDHPSCVWCDRRV